MLIRKFAVFATLLLVGGCAHKSQPLWQAQEARDPVDILYLPPSAPLGNLAPLQSGLGVGATAKDLLSAEKAPDFVVRLDQDRALLRLPERYRLERNMGPGSPGQLVGEGEMYVPVVIESAPEVEFHFDPQGKDVQAVALAGAFNGWSNSKDLFQKGDDGIFRLKKTIKPGNWTYKFVVDGEWMADPSNPKMDDSGFGNSLLTVEGQDRNTFPIHYLSANAPGSGPQGSFAAVLREGDALRPEKATVLLNNNLLPADSYTVDSAGRVVLDVPGSLWGRENYVTVMLESESGATGEVQVPIIYGDAPRSPADEVIYFAMTDRFLDGDPANNPEADHENVPPLAEYHGGDWAGIAERIEDGYFDHLGVTTLWISPVNENTFKVEKESVPPGRSFTSYHGYWPVSSTATNPAFGSMEELQGLIGTAHRNGIAVLLDFVANHVHEDHPMFRENPALATPLELPDGSLNIRQFDAHPLTTWFDTFLPTLDYVNNPEAVDIMTDNGVWWLRETGADGFRHDAVKHIPVEFWMLLTSKLKVLEKEEGRRVYQVGETISGHDTVAQYLGAMDGQFDFPTYFTIQNVLARGHGEMKELADAIRMARRYYPISSVMSPLVGNHDVARFMAYADNDFPEGVDEKEVGWTNPPQVDDPQSHDRLRLAFAYLMALPGAPMIYYGDEIGMTGAHDPDNRRMMKWDDWSDEELRTFATLSRLTHTRHGSVALRRGVTEVLFADAERLILAKVAPEETVLVALSRKPQDGSVTMVWPQHWGTPSQLEPLITQNLQAETTSNALRITDGEYAFGVWRVEW
jgi:glycosidase